MGDPLLPSFTSRGGEAEARSSLAERCLYMADEGVRFLPRLPAAVPAGRSRPPSGLFFMSVRSAGAGAVPSDPTQR